MKRKMSSQNTKRLPLPHVPSGGTRVSCRPPNRYMLLKPIIKFYVLKNRIVYRKVIKKKKTIKNSLPRTLPRPLCPVKNYLNICKTRNYWTCTVYFYLCLILAYPKSTKWPPRACKRSMICFMYKLVKCKKCVISFYRKYNMLFDFF